MVIMYLKIQNIKNCAKIHVHYNRDMLEGLHICLTATQYTTKHSGF